MTILFLVRHAVHDLVGKALVGRAPGVPLSPEGVRQAEGLRHRFAREPIVRLLSSPIQRCLETAAILAGAHDCVVEPVDDLLEIDCGEWTGSSFDSLAQDPRWHAWNDERHQTAIPGGETMRAVSMRVSRLLDLLTDQSGPVVLVTHADVIKAAIAGLIDMPLKLHHRLLIDPASITTIEMWEPGAGQIVRMNETVKP